MSYRLQADETLGKGIKRIALEQIDDALAHLKSPGDDLDKAVHESHKCLQKLRGLLRLARKEIGEAVYQQENVCFRDAGRLLTDLRNSAVMIQTTDDLAEADADVIEDEAFMTMRETLVIFYHSTRQRVVEEEQALAKAADMVLAVQGRVDGWSIEADSFTDVAGGLRKIYKRGRNGMDSALANPSADAFHEWRKRVKYLWYSIRILHPIWPQPMAALAAELHDLANILGDEHDLAQLHKLVEKRPPLLSNDIARANLNTLIDRKRTELQTDAFQRGRRIYHESPDAFVDRASAYWIVTRK